MYLLRKFASRAIQHVSLEITQNRQQHGTRFAYTEVKVEDYGEFKIVTILF